MQNKRIILSGGGTGGHIFPAVSIARKIQSLYPDIDILFVGATGKMEMEKVPKAGFKIVGLPVSGFHRRLTIKNLSFLFKLFASLIKANKVIKEFKPDLVIGTGGFASGPIVKAASRKGIPSLIQEQNAFPGVTNRMLGKRAAYICVAHSGLEKYFPEDKIIVSGNPVRDDIININASKEEAKNYFEIDNDQPTIFVFGGSLGAASINKALMDNIESLGEKGVNLIWQTGSSSFEKAAERVASSGNKNLKVFEFIYRMDLAYKMADIIISRAGAISISELCLVGKPAVLVPYPHAAGNHQLKNARSLEEKNAAIVIEDQNVDNELVPRVLALLEDEELLKKLGKNIISLAKPEATDTIARLALKILTD